MAAVRLASAVTLAACAGCDTAVSSCLAGWLAAWPTKYAPLPTAAATARMMKKVEMRMPMHRHFRRLGLGEAPRSGRRRELAEPVEHLERRAREAARLPGVFEVAANDVRDHGPGERQPGDSERQAREAVERVLRRPRGAVQGAELREHARLVRGEVAGEDRLRRELAADERLVHPVAGQRVDEPRRVPDEHDVVARHG